MALPVEKYFSDYFDVKLPEETEFKRHLLLLKDGSLLLQSGSVGSTTITLDLLSITLQNENTHVKLFNDTKEYTVLTDKDELNMKFWYRLNRAINSKKKDQGLIHRIDYKAEYLEITHKCNSFIQKFTKESRCFDTLFEPQQQLAFFQSIYEFGNIFLEDDFAMTLFDHFDRIGFSYTLAQKFKSLRKHFKPQKGKLSTERLLHEVHDTLINIFVNGSWLSDLFAKAISRYGILKYMIEDLKFLLRNGVEEVKLEQAPISRGFILYNCTRTLEGKKEAKKLGATTILQPILKSHLNSIKLTFYGLFSNIIEDNEVHMMKTDELFMTCLLEMVQKCLQSDDLYASLTGGSYNYHLSVILYCLKQLLIEDNNREMFLRKEPLDIFERVLSTNDTRSRKHSLGILRVIAGKGEFKAQLKSDKKELLDEIRKMSYEDYELAEEARITYTLITEEEIPSVIMEMDEHSIQSYLKAVSEGSELSTDIRLMIVGHQCVGKTSLCLRLRGIHPMNVQRTNGIDIYTLTFIIDCDTGEWDTLEKDTETQNTMLKLGLLTQSMQNPKLEDQISSREVAAIRKIENTTETPNTEDDIVYETDMASAVPEQMIETVTDKVSDTEKIEDKKQNATNLSRENVLNIRETFRVISGKKLPKNRAFLSMFDFAGDVVFYATHQAFLSSNAVYAVVIDFSKPLVAQPDVLEETQCSKDSSQEETLFWLRSICTFATSRTLRNRTFPPIIVIGTHKDKMQQKTNEEKIKAAKFEFAQFLNSLGMEKEVYRSICGPYLIDNTCEDITDHDLELIKTKIVELAQKQSYWNDHIPAKWIILERELMIAKGKGIKFLKLREIYKIDLNSESPIKDEKQIQLCLRYYHAVGHLLYFDRAESELRDTVMIDPQWISYAFREIITSPNFEMPETNSTVCLLWNDLQEKARLSSDLIDFAWGNSELDHERFADNKKELLFVMEQLFIIAKPLNLELDELSTTNYIVPSLLQNPVLKDILSWLERETVSTCTLCFVCRDRFIPIPVFDNLIACCIRRWSVVTGNDMESPLYRGCGCFKLEGPYMLLLFCNRNMVQAKVYRRYTREKSIDSQIVSEVREFIEMMLIGLRDLFKHQQLVFEHFVCRNPGKTDVTDIVYVKELEKHQEVYCRKEDTNIHIDEIDVWYRKNSCKITQTALSINDMFPQNTCSRKPTEKELCFLSANLGVAITSLATCLGLSDAARQHIELDHSDSSREQIFEILLAWRNSNSHKTTSTISYLLERLHEQNVDIKSTRIRSIFDNKTDEDAFELPEPFIPLEDTLLLDTHFRLICLEINPKVYRYLGITLGLSNTEITRIHSDFTTSKERIYQMLIKWKQKFPDQATMKKVAIAMVECRMSIECLIHICKETVVKKVAEDVEETQIKVIP